MNVLYHLPILKPKIAEAEAISQEISLLQTQHRGPIVYVNPNSGGARVRVPRLLFGVHLLSRLRHIERTQHIDVHHIYNPDPYPYPYLRLLQRPVIYSLTGGLQQFASAGFFRSLGAVTAQDEDSVRVLQSAGVTRSVWARPWVDSARFRYATPPQDGTVRLLMASAPWTLEQFRTKGVFALLDAASQNARLHLTLLWRGVHADEIMALVAERNLGERVTVINGLADVNSMLAGAHAAIVMATTPQLVKAYPHSLLDSLAAGKPVLVSQPIPMARYVSDRQCGEVIQDVTGDAVRASVNRLMARYEHYSRNARLSVQTDFRVENLLASMSQAYTLATGH